jgi:hypothetical protein
MSEWVRSGIAVKEQVDKEVTSRSQVDSDGGTVTVPNIDQGYNGSYITYFLCFPLVAEWNGNLTYSSNPLTQ